MLTCESVWHYPSWFIKGVWRGFFMNEDYGSFAYIQDLFFGALLSSEQIGTGSSRVDSYQRGAFRPCELKNPGTPHTWICTVCATWPGSLDEDTGAHDQGLFWCRCWTALLSTCLWRHQWTKLRFGVIKWNCQTPELCYVHKMSHYVWIFNGIWRVCLYCLLLWIFWYWKVEHHISCFQRCGNF